MALTSLKKLKVLFFLDKMDALTFSKAVNDGQTFRFLAGELDSLFS